MEHTIVLIPNGRTGNNLFQLAFGRYLQTQINNSNFEYPAFPEIGIEATSEYQNFQFKKADLTISEQDKGIEQLSMVTNSRYPLVIRLEAWGMQKKYYMNSKDWLKKLLGPEIQTPIQPENNCHNKLLIHVRGGDIWAPRFRSSHFVPHEDYLAPPIDYFRKVIQESNLEPRLLIQTERMPRWYRKEIISEFGKENIIYSSSVSNDFRSLYHAQEIAIGISTFSWMAAFLGKSKKIYYPVCGIFDKNQRADIDIYDLAKQTVYLQFSKHRWNGTKMDHEWLLNAKAINREK